MNKKLNKIYAFLMDSLALIAVIAVTIGALTFMAIMIKLAGGVF
ncbi:hypothetical protein [Weissella soli]|nr:hypothetical protein [Weissella soli]